MPRPLDPLLAGLCSLAMLGPVVSKTQWDKIQGLIQKGIDEGATLVAGGTGRPEGLDKGYYVKPTVFANVNNQMTIAKEEIFGPVLSILGYDSLEQAIDWIIVQMKADGLDNVRGEPAPRVVPHLVPIAYPQLGLGAARFAATMLAGWLPSHGGRLAKSRSRSAGAAGLAAFSMIIWA